MTLADFPRILVVTSNNFNQVTGGGITLTNLFRGWPADRIANLHEDSTPEDDSVCRIFYRLSVEEIQWAWPFSLVQSWYEGKSSVPDRRRVVGDGTHAVPATGGHGRAAWLRLARQMLGDGIPRTARITQRLAHWLDEFRPEVLYTFLGSMAQIRLSSELARLLAIPVAIHMMDDWPAVLYRRGLLGPMFRRVVLKEFEAVLRRASLHFGICQDMCEEYEDRYGVPFLAFHNAIDMDQWLPHAKRDWKEGLPFIVRYVGSIVPDGQQEALRDICEAVASLNGSGVSVQMWVHSPKDQLSHLRDSRFPPDCLHLSGPPSSETIATLLSEADLLVLPFNFDARSAQYVRLSMPTKVPAYMVSGTPVLVYGPLEMATVRYAERDGWGDVVSTPGILALREALSRLMHDQAAREHLGRRAQMLAQQNHDAAKIRPAFQAALSKAAAGISTTRV